MYLTGFLTDMTVRGAAFGSRYLMSFTMPPKLMEYASKAPRPLDVSILQNLQLRCDATELPGASFVTGDNKVMGPIYKMPNQILYNDLTLSFILSADLAEKYFFEYWMEIIMDRNNYFGYYNDFTTDHIMVHFFDTMANNVYGARFWHCYPTAINQVSLNWQDTDIARLSVTFAYERFLPIWQPALKPNEFANMINQDELGLKVIRDFIYGVAPSIPGAQRFLGNPITQDLMNGRGLNLQQVTQQGLGMAVNSINTKDPISRTLISASTSSLSKLLGGGF